MENDLDETGKVKRYQLALAGSNICIWDWMDVEKKEQWWSPRFYKFLGYEQDELKASVDTFKELLHPEDVDRVFDALEDHFKKKTPFLIEYRLMTKAGLYKWFRASGQTEFDEDGDPVRIAGNLIAIHDRKQAKLKQKKERRLLRTIIDNIPASVYVKDLEGRKILANESEYKLWGFSTEDEIIGKTDADLSTAKGAAKSAEEDKKVLETGEPIIEKDVYTEINGEDYVLLASKLPIRDEQGEVIGLVGISVDITDRKQMEDQLIERNEQLKKLHEATNKIYSVVGHDLKTPLSSILGISELIIGEFEAERRADDLVEDIKIIRQSALKMSDLLEDLLRWARVQTGDVSINREEFTLADTIENAADLLSLTAEQKGISVRINNDASFDVYADEQMIATIIRNFLSNAIKFSDTGDTITIKQEYKDENWSVSVVDEGKGISTESLENLFDYQDHPVEEGTDNEKGSGIGLRLCKELAELHNGEIIVESDLGKGSVFTLTIPRSKKVAN